MKKLLNNIKEVFADNEQPICDKGDLVQSVLIIGGFAISTIVVMTWISVAIINKGADRANCIEKANTFTQEGVEVCSWEESVINDDTTFKNDSEYQERFPTN